MNHQKPPQNKTKQNTTNALQIKSPTFRSGTKPSLSTIVDPGTLPVLGTGCSSPPPNECAPLVFHRGVKWSRLSGAPASYSASGPRANASRVAMVVCFCSVPANIFSDFSSRCFMFRVGRGQNPCDTNVCRYVGMGKQGKGVEQWCACLVLGVTRIYINIRSSRKLSESQLLRPHKQDADPTKKHILE